ncbi:MAG: hypothetical protein IKU58_02660 [Clostridia bacterium]|nr:hypothetical protein [Clostridia bacterium]
MRNWLQKVMAGRYGVDEFNRCLNMTALITLVLSVLFNGALSMIFWLMAIMALIYSYFRMFSRNTYRRRAENNAYLTLRYSLTCKFSGIKQRREQRKYYRFFKCPKCGITTRVPKGKGKIRITCPKCGESFVRKS